MKIKLDENIPARLVNILSQFGHEIDTVPQEGLIGYEDHRVWEAAQNSRSFLITQDLDFSNTERFKPGHHFGILLVRLRAPGREALVRRVKSLFRDEDVERWTPSPLAGEDGGEGWSLKTIQVSIEPIFKKNGLFYFSLLTRYA